MFQIAHYEPKSIAFMNTDVQVADLWKSRDVGRTVYDRLTMDTHDDGSAIGIDDLVLTGTELGRDPSSCGWVGSVNSDPPG
jgi:hypothetical protein